VVRCGAHIGRIHGSADGPPMPPTAIVRRGSARSSCGPIIHGATTLVPVAAALPGAQVKDCPARLIRRHVADLPKAALAALHGRHHDASRRVVTDAAGGRCRPLIR